MELLSGFPLLIQQYKALLKKNAILTWRSKRSAIVQLFSSLFFMLLLFGVDRAIRAQAATHTEFKNVRDPPTKEAPPIPPCEDKFFAKPPCYDFVWSGTGARIQGIVKGIMKNNPGREISDDRVKSFRTPEEVDTWLLDNPLRCPGALHFVEKNSTVISYGVQTNSTNVDKRGQNEDPTFKFQIPLQIAAEREIARSLLGDPNFIWTVGFKEFAHPATETSSSMDTLGPTFFLAVAMFSFVFQISALVAEKELKLRQAMSMMGLYESAYWLSWLTWETLLTLISALFTVLFGMMFQFDFFLKNNFAIVFLVFFLFQLAMLGFAFMISTLMSKSSSATTVGFAIFIVGFLAQFAGMLIYTDIIEKKYQILWSLFPPNPLAAALRMLAAATATPDDHGISWSKRGECGPKSPNCVMTIEDVLLWLIATFVLWFVVALYLDNIIPNSNGVRKPVYYFLQPSYWTGKGGEKVKEGSLFSWRSSAPSLQEVTPDDEDVLAEETTVKRQASENETDPNVAVQICGLAKTYPGTISCRCRCCKCCCSKSPPYHAVKGIWVNLAKNQLFCLLGPNGAGKTTAISCLTGITPVTGGDALIYGHSVRNPIGMSNIRRIIGVCPQFDILWDALSSSEHLHLFSSLKGLPPSTINSAVEKSLAEVKLTRAAKVRAGSYSGGMKRRLSVAIALLGDPKLVFLDEPTTGMDPISRRHVWDIIGEAKKGRAIVLTTHSMEEADILSDRIAIMAKGRLRCLGTSIRLKSRFGTGYIATVNFQGSVHGSDAGSKEPRAEPLKKFFKFHLNLDPKEETKSFLTYIIPREKEGILTDFFAELQLKEKELGITDIQLGLTTLEEVFLNIAKKAEIESSAAEGTLVQITLASGASVQIPVGARFVGIPGTVSSENPSGLMVEVYWDQDDSGRLCVSGHSDETPIPSSVPSAANALTRRASRGRSPVGFVIDPNQITSGRGQH